MGMSVEEYNLLKWECLLKMCISAKRPPSSEMGMSAEKEKLPFISETESNEDSPDFHSDSEDSYYPGTEDNEDNYAIKFCD